MRESREVSHCESRWGMCMRDPRCPDKHCPGHPTNTCSTCAGGVCRTPQACMQPLQELPVRIERNLFTSRSDARRVVRRIGIAVLILFFLYLKHVFTKGTP